MEIGETRRIVEYEPIETEEEIPVEHEVEVENEPVPA